MIVKTTRWKSMDIGKLVNYILTDKGRIKDPNDSFTIFHNFQHTDEDLVTREFRENDQFRTKRKRGVVMYHEVLSFHPNDTEKLTADILEDLSQKYIEIRGQNALVLAKPHLENQNVHIHFAFSGTELKSSKTLRMNNAEFARNRKAIEQYQVEKYPHLDASLVYLNKKELAVLNQKDRDKHGRQEKEYQLKKRGKLADKDQLKIKVREAYHQANNLLAFYRNLEQQNLSIYERRGRKTGILFGKRKFRFSTLGIDKAMLKKLEQNVTLPYSNDIEQRKKELEALRQQKAQRHKRKRDRGLEL